MEKIASFQVDHNKLLEGVYISRIDKIKDVTLTTFDIRMKKPNAGDYIKPESAHTLEHLLATFFRSDRQLGDKVIYFGPMGCQTGMYLILAETLSPAELIPFLKRAMSFVISFNEELPGGSEVECGQAALHSIDSAKKDAAEYLNILESITEQRMTYSFIE